MHVQNKRLFFKTNEAATRSIDVLFEDGVMIIQTAPSNYPVTETVRIENMIPAPDGSGMPMTVKMNMRENEPEMKKHLDRIQKATGKTFEFQVNMGEVYNSVVKSKPRDAAELGVYVYDKYLRTVAEDIETACKDSMVKEALCDTLAGTKIIFRLNADQNEDNQIYLFESGNLVMQINPKYFPVRANLNMVKML